MEGFLAVLILLVAPIASAALVVAAVEGGGRMMRWISLRRETKIARIEAELDRKQDELHSTVMSLATSIGMEAHEARRRLIRESYLASGAVPDSPTER